MPQMDTLELAFHEFLEGLHKSMPLGPRDVGERAFKNAMSRLGFSIAIVTAQAADGPIGRTATSFMPLSAAPARILVSVDAQSRLAGVISHLGVFSMSFLAAGQEAIGDAFAGKRPPNERFKVGRWEEWSSGNPMLQGAALAIDCSVIGSIDTGEHILFVGSIVGSECSDGASPLIWHDRGYRTLRA